MFILYTGDFNSMFKAYEGGNSICSEWFSLGYPHTVCVVGMTRRCTEHVAFNCAS